MPGGNVGYDWFDIKRNDWEQVLKNAKRLFKPGYVNKVLKRAVDKGTVIQRRALVASAKRHTGDGKRPDGSSRKHLWQAVQRKRSRVAKRKTSVYGKVVIPSVGDSAHAHLVNYGTYRGKIPELKQTRAKGRKFIKPVRKKRMTEFLRTGKDISYKPHWRENHAKKTLFVEKASDNSQSQVLRTMLETASQGFKQQLEKSTATGRGFNVDIA